MARLYISILGTTDYKVCTYYTGDFELRDVRFVQEATVDLLCRDWSKEDRILILTTSQAWKKNWLDDGHEKNGEVLHKQGLRSRLAALGLETLPREVMIPEGHSEAEIWEIFQRLYDQIEVGDEVVFDITHAFRSIPMLALVVLHYAKVLKNVEVKGIYYGAFEAIGDPREVDQMPLEMRRAPLLDLTSFDVLLDWSLGVYLFTRGGDASMCSNLAQAGVHPILRDTRGANEDARKIRSVAEKMRLFSRDLSTCRCLQISDDAQALKGLLGSAPSSSVLPPFKPLLEKVKDEVASFTGDRISDGIAAAKWCLRHNLIQQSCTILYETIVGHLCILAGLDPDYRESRMLVNQAVAILADNLPPDKWHPPASKDQGLTAACLKVLERHDDLTEIHRNLSSYRNDLNHCGWRQEAMPAGKFERLLDQLITSAEKAVSCCR